MEELKDLLNNFKISITVGFILGITLTVWFINNNSLINILKPEKVKKLEAKCIEENKDPYKLDDPFAFFNK